jgi:glutamate-1-semialdehyde 2,1-aminomutase
VPLIFDEVYTGFRLAPSGAQDYFNVDADVVVGLRVAYLTWKHNLRISMIWFVKLVTDPMTDIMSYVPALARRA